MRANEPAYSEKSGPPEKSCDVRNGGHQWSHSAKISLPWTDYWHLASLCTLTFWFHTYTELVEQSVLEGKKKQQFFIFGIRLMTLTAKVRILNKDSFQMSSKTLKLKNKSCLKYQISLTRQFILYGCCNWAKYKEDVLSNTINYIYCCHSLLH